MRGVGRLWGVAVAGLALAACSSVGAGSVPTVLVDYSHDEFASQFMSFFPKSVEVHAGDTVTFRQTWTGEPHTVTLGTVIGPVLETTVPLLDEYGELPEHEVPPEVMEEYGKAMSTLPPMENEAGEIVQGIMQPCVVATGEIPQGDGPCPDRDLQPFTGTETYYNSGVIPFEGSGQNRFDLRLADTIAPGSYPFFCAIHGPLQSGVLEVVPDDEPVPSPRDIAVRARAEIDEEAGPMEDYFLRARDEGVLVVGGQRHEGNFAGIVTRPQAGMVTGQVNEFLPKDVTVPVGEPVTWRMFGAHSVAFDVPEYFPIVEFADDGTVTYNDAVNEPAGGAPPLPTEDEPPPEGPLVVDGGTWDGSGFYSSGTLWSPEHVEFTLRFSEPGTYPYACLIHPPMVGTVRVTS